MSYESGFGSNGGDTYHYGEDVDVASHADGGGYLFQKGELLVATESSNDVQALLGEWGQPPDRVVTYSPGWERMFLGEASPPASQLVTRLLAMPVGYRVSPNHVVKGNTHGVPIGTGSPPRRAESLGPPPPVGSETGSVRLVVLDDGVFLKHSYFDGRVEKIIGQGMTSTNPDELEAYGDRLSGYEGHGTFVIGTVLQHAPWATVVVGPRILDGYGQATDTDLADAIRRLDDDIDILLLSAGAPTHANMGLPATEEALTEAWSKNPKLVVVAPAGNAAGDIKCFPGALKGVISVAALGTDGKRAAFSNHGNWVDACAPGVDVKSTFITYRGRVASRGTGPSDDVVHEFEGYAYWSGTCFAAARVAGAIAYRMHSTGVDAAEAAYQLVGRGKARLIDRDCDLGVPVYAPSWP